MWTTVLLVIHLMIALALVAVVLLLFTVIFPWLEPRLPFNDVTVDETPTSVSTSVTPSSS